MSKQRSTSCFIIIASQQKSVLLNSHMNSANKAICYVEVINMYSLHELQRVFGVHLFQFTRAQAGWLTHPPKCSLTDA